MRKTKINWYSGRDIPSAREIQVSCLLMNKERLNPSPSSLLNNYMLMNIAS